MKQFLLWLWHRTVQVYSFSKRAIGTFPEKVKKIIFRFAHWGKRQLDKRINPIQKKQLHKIVFETDTKEGHLFDMVLIWIIVASVVAVILETVSSYRAKYWWTFFVLEWIFTLIFTVEYIIRLYCARKPIKYATSFFGIVDLLALIPTYISVFFIGAQHLLIVRALRLLRVFRIFKMGHFVKEGAVIVSALQASKTKISIFMSFVVLMSIIIGSLMYIVEGDLNEKIDNIPKGIYWAIVTLTTVGYGDVTPLTPFGQFLATVVMIMGYGVIAVPTGIVTAEISGRVMNLKEVEFKQCENCDQSEHHTGSLFCHRCGGTL